MSDLDRLIFTRQWRPCLPNGAQRVCCMCGCAFTWAPKPGRAPTVCGDECRARRINATKRAYDDRHTDEKRERQREWRHTKRTSDPGWVERQRRQRRAYQRRVRGIPEAEAAQRELGREVGLAVAARLWT